MTRALAARLSKLEAARNAAPKVVGVIGGEYGGLIVDPENPGRLIRVEPPGGFAEFCRRQQAELIATLTAFAEQDDAEEQPAPVGIAASRRPDGFVFEYNGEDFVVVEGEARPVRNRRKH